MKKIIVTLGIFAVCSLQAQDLSMKNMLKLGIGGGISFSDNSNGNLGLDVSYQHLVTGNLGIGLSTGYSQHFAKDHKQVTFNNYGIVPLAGMVKYYFNSEGLYLGTDIGYSFVTGAKVLAKNYSVEMPFGGFYVKPEIGYHNRNWNFFVHYAKTFLPKTYEISGKKFAIGTLGLGVAYNIALGK